MQDTQARGRDVLLPVGCSGYDEWLLDALSVDRVLKQLRSNSAKLDLINACVSTSAIGGSLAAAARRESLATPPRGSSSALDASGDAADFRRLVSGTPPHGTPSVGGAGMGATSEALDDDADSGLPQLRLKSLHVGEQLDIAVDAAFTSRSCGDAHRARSAGHVRHAARWRAHKWRVFCPRNCPGQPLHSALFSPCHERHNITSLLRGQPLPAGSLKESAGAVGPAGPPLRRLRRCTAPLRRAGLAEHQLKELAFTVFLSCCGGRASRGLLADLRASLELSEARAEELARILELVTRHGVSTLATLEAHVKLLQVGAPLRALRCGRHGSAVSWRGRRTAAQCSPFDP